MSSGDTEKDFATVLARCLGGSYALDRIRTALRSAQAEVVDLRRERDEAREELECIKDCHPEHYSDPGSRTRLALAAMELAEAYCACVRVTGTSEVYVLDAVCDDKHAAYLVMRAEAEGGVMGEKHDIMDRMSEPDDGINWGPLLDLLKERDALRARVALLEQSARGLVETCRGGDRGAVALATAAMDRALDALDQGGDTHG